ncbi:hypothetical protein Q4555_11745 [Octadecabacter sp. 1_MG-2023]|uniref:hypothetical protein n=1 Tax=unclassified Octadecabacter TaxID=196158 RepID=UPI001C08B8F4|nr:MULTISPECIES: hypothetical protein [unclassified Octadecabacter]MBU2993813.1 hypothetical protein [Octadecabacter sp. B2R22]MDO6735342.1 hypothetical protein [Octadecabacter sp. 1_MG-2023]
MFKMTRLASLALAGSFAVPATADETQPAVAEVMVAMADARLSDNYILIEGGFYDGAAATQTVRFIVTPEDEVLCTFIVGAMFDDEEFNEPATARGYAFEKAGMFNDLSEFLLPNNAPPSDAFTFTIEAKQDGVLSISSLGWMDPRYDLFRNYIGLNHNSCWTFG